MATELIRELYDYHHWANRRLFEVAQRARRGGDVARHGQALELSRP